MKVIALDPGVTTGVAYGTIRDGLMTTYAEQYNWSHQALYEHLREREPDVIVCESFEYRAKSRAGLILYPVELIGVVHLFHQSNPPVELVMQSAAKGKSYYSDAHLKDAGVYLRGVGHGMDALRHLLHWFTFGPGYKHNTEGFR